MTRHPLCHAALVLLGLTAALAGPCRLAARVEAAEGDAPRNTQAETEPFLTPQQALAALQLPQGFRATLFAHEPDVQNPIALCTDSRGRLWVAENYTYAERELNYDLTQNDRIIVFEDTNGDGIHDFRKVFWDRGKKLTSLQVGFGGVWVTCAPHLLFIPDRNRDDVPDGEPEVILEGFDGDSIRHNIVNGLKWGPDGWLYGRHGIQATSRVGRPGDPDAERVSLNCCVWRYHPTRKTFEVVAQGTTNPWGMDWDEHGECWLINTVIGHLWHVVPGAYWKRMYGSHFNPHLYELIDQTADHIHWAEGEKWNDVQKGISSTTDAAGGGHAHCGLLFCDRTWPDAYRGSVLTANLHGRRLNRDSLHREGCGYTAHHEADCFFSRDPYFRVIELEHARDGGMYLADWSDIGECHENDGVHRTSGRIFKITWNQTAYAGREQEQRLAGNRGDLSTLPAESLVAMQSCSEWYARMARRILQERAARGDDLDAVVRPLADILRSESDEILALRALWTLDAMGRLTREHLKLVLESGSEEHLRAHAARLLVTLPQSAGQAAEDTALLTNLAVNCNQPLVRLYLASALQAIEPQYRLRLAHALALHAEDAHDRQQPLMIWYGIEPVVATDPTASLAIAAETPMPQLVRCIARRLTHELESRPEGAAALVPLLHRLAGMDDARCVELLSGMTAALQGWRHAKAPAGWETTAAVLAASKNSEVARLSRELSVVFGDGRAVDELRAIVRDGSAPVDSRRSALRSLVAARASDLEPLLKDLLGNRDFTAECIRGLARIGGAEAPRLITSRYSGFRLEFKEEAIAALVSRPDFAPQLLEAVAEGKIPRSHVASFQLRQMLSYGNDTLSARIRELWPELQQLSESKQQRIRELTAQLSPEAIAAGDPAHGRVLFAAACAKCHKLFGEGGTTAPELTGAQRTNLAYLLENIVDPSATISKNYKMSIAILDDGRVLNGVVTNPTDRTITLQTPTESLVLDRESIEELRETELSLMPEGQLDRLSATEVRDLIAYLMSAAQVPLPAAAGP